MDQSSELIRTATLTGAKVGDSVVADQLISGDERAVYADRAYESIERSARLAKLGIFDGIMRKLMPHSRDPHPVLAARNRRLAGVRFAVERRSTRAARVDLRSTAKRRSVPTGRFLNGQLIQPVGSPAAAE